MDFHIQKVNEVINGSIPACADFPFYPMTQHSPVGCGPALWTCEMWLTLRAGLVGH